MVWSDFYHILYFMTVAEYERRAGSPALNQNKIYEG
jgi:hypothetical protein